MRQLGVAAALAAIALAACNARQPAETAAMVPDLSGYWVRPEAGSDRIFYPPEEGAGPLVNQDATAEYMIGDPDNPLLKPEAAAAVRSHAEAGKRGEVLLPPWSLCWPTGVPLDLNMAEPVQFLQEPGQVTILYQRGMQVRRIYLADRHRADPQPSWYGDAIGHYESGDTLVVDVTAQKTDSRLDRFGTPHSAGLHVVERYTVAPDKKTLKVSFTIEDTAMFTEPWSGSVAYVRPEARHGYNPDAAPFEEIVCPENNRDPSGGDLPLPIDHTPDF
jgi:hypothetical protein